MYTCICVHMYIYIYIYICAYIYSSLKLGRALGSVGTGCSERTSATATIGANMDLSIKH